MREAKKAELVDEHLIWQCSYPLVCHVYLNKASNVLTFSNLADRYGRHDNAAMPVAKGS